MGPDDAARKGSAERRGGYAGAVPGAMFGASPEECAAVMNTSARMEQIEVLKVELSVLRQEHRDLDQAIRALEERNSPSDMLTIRRLKKQKLHLKDRIQLLEDRITPDIIA